MSDKDFDKFFSRKLQEEQPYPIDDRDWETLSSRLDAHNDKKPAGWLSNNRWAWLLPFLLLLLGFNVWSLVKMNDAEKNNSILNDELKDMKTLLQKQDTLKQIQYIYKTDTVVIYKTVIKDKTISSTFDTERLLQSNSNYYLNPNNSNQIPQEDNQGYLGFNKSIENKKVGLNTEKTNPSILSLDKTEISNNSAKNIGESSENALKNDVIEQLSLLKPTGVKEEIKPKPELIALNFSNFSTPSIIKTEKFNRFYIGIGGGRILYHTLWRNKDGIEIGRDEKSYQVGLKMEYALTNNWRATISTDYCPYDFKISWIDKRYNLSPLPTYYNPAASVMNSIKGSQKLYLGSLGMKYVLNQSRWKPYFGVAYSAMRIEPYDVEYTYTHTSTSKTYTYTTHLIDGANIKNILLFNGGLEYRISKHLIAQADAFYYKDANKVQKTYDLYGLRGAFLFGF